MRLLLLRELVPAMLCFSIFGGHSGAAQTPQKAEDGTTIRSATSLVFVPALVMTTGKELVYSLAAGDFLLTDDGVPQKVRLDEDRPQPLSLVVLMQTGGAARLQFRNYAHLDSMIAAILGEPPNKLAIVNFDSRPEADSPFTSDVAQWKDAIDEPEPGTMAPRFLMVSRMPCAC